MLHETKADIAEKVLNEIIEERYSGYRTSCIFTNKEIRILYAPSFINQAKKFRKNTKFIQDFGKLYDSLKQGYQGGSKGGINGIVNIRKTDEVLWQDYHKWFGENSQYLIDLELPVKDSQKFKAVKVVAHIPSGNRLIGALYEAEENYTLVIFGVSNYNGKPKY